MGDKGKIALIITVGKSLIENYIKDQDVTNIIRADMTGCESLKLKECENKLKNYIKEQDLEDELKKFLSIAEENSYKKCAELKGVARFLQDLRDNSFLQDLRDNSKIDVWLIGTESQNGEEGSNFVAEVLKDYIEDKKEEDYKNIETVELKDIPDPFTSNERKFYESLNKLVDVINEIIEKNNYNKIFLFISGGYKGFIPFLTLLSTLYSNVWIVYTFEESDKNFYIPPLPFSLDVFRLDTFRSILKMEKINKETVDSLKDAFPESEVLFAREHPTTDCKETSFKKVINKRYDELKYIRSYSGEMLLNMIEDKCLKEKIKAKLRFWNYLWIGDQIPETVEHSKFHSLRLMEYAYLIIKYYPEIKEKLGSEGLAILFTSIWLHDIGHGALTFKLKPSNEDKILNKVFKIPPQIPDEFIAFFPHFIRDCHHILSVHMLEEDFEFLLPDFPEEFKNACKLAILYHRKEMPLHPGHVEEIKKNKCYEAYPLEKVVDEIGFWENIKDKVVFTAAFLSFIDGLDVQSDRVGSKEYSKMRNIRDKYEINFHKYVLEKLSINGFYDKACELENLWENEEYDQLKKEDKNIKQTKLPDTKDNFLLSSLRRLHFITLQKEHFIKHSLVDACVIERGNNEGELKVIFLVNKDVVGENVDKYIKSVKEDVNEEWERVKNYFKNYITKIVYFKREGDKEEEI